MTGRPRRTDVEVLVRPAVLGLLAEVGYGATTIDAVATRAGVGKPAIYRRWADKPTLVADAFEHALAEVNPPPDAPADVGRAVLAALTNVVHLVHDTPFGAALAAVVGELHHEPVLRAAADRVEARRRQVLRGLLRQARTEGRLAPGWSIDLAVDALLGTIYFGALVRGTRVSPHEVKVLVGQVVRPAPVRTP